MALGVFSEQVAILVIDILTGQCRSGRQHRQSIVPGRERKVAREIALVPRAVTQAKHVSTRVVGILFGVSARLLDIRAFRRFLPGWVWRLEVALAAGGGEQAIKRVVGKCAIQFIRLGLQAAAWRAVMDRQNISGKIVVVSEVLQWLTDRMIGEAIR